MEYLKTSFHSIFRDQEAIQEEINFINKNKFPKRNNTISVLYSNLKWTLLFSIFVFMSHAVEAQKLVVVYEHHQINLPEEILRFVPQMLEEKNISRFSLYINNGRSMYTRDSIYLADDKPRNSQSSFAFKRIYKNYNEDLWVENSAALQKGYCLKKNLSDLKKEYDYFNWNITEEKSTIVGIECVKAVSNNGSFVWYAPGIPYPDGPEHGIFNLPGLVLWYETPYHQWKAVSTFFEKRDLNAPDCIMEEKEEKIRLTLIELKDLSEEDCIRLNKNTPLKQWLRLKN